MTSHPYYPTDLSIPHYIPNNKSTLELLVIVGGIFSALALLSIVGCHSLSKNVTSSTRFTWFFINSLLHLGFEGYWLINRETLAGKNDLFAQLWKEYANGDSRYLSADELLLTLETMTIFIWGPLCMMSAWFIWKGSRKQYIFQLIASLCHLFSCSLYYIMDLPAATHCNPNPFYFWIYFIAFNAPWIIVPSFLVFQSYQHINQALSTKIHNN